MINFKLLKRYLWMTRFTYPNQIFWRIFFKVKRFYLLNYGDAKCLHKDSNITIDMRIPIGPIIPNLKNKKKLPIKYELAGFSIEINKDLDFNNEILNFGNRLEKLTLHYMDFINDLNPEESVFLIKNWIKNIKPYSKDFWRDSFNCYGVSKRLINWVDFISGNRNVIDKNIMLLLSNSIVAQARFLFNNFELDIGGNHLLKNIRSILRVASFLEGDEVDLWILKSIKILKIELKNQILNDGMHFELSPCYHSQVLEDFLCIRRSLIYLKKYRKKSYFFDDLLDNLNSKIEEMINPLIFFTHPTGKHSQFADGSLKISPKTNELLLLLTSFQKNKNLLKENIGVWRLDHAGFFGFKTQNSNFIYKAGRISAPNLPAHGHGDIFSYEWSLCSQNFIIDTGVFEYHPGSKREYSRSTRAHNTLTIDNQDQGDFWSSFRLGKRPNVYINNKKITNNELHINAFHDGYSHLKGNPIHKRIVKFKLKKLDVTDIVEYKKYHPHKICSRILISEKTLFNNCLLNKKFKYFEFYLKDYKKNTLIKIILNSNLPFIIEDAFYYPDFGKVRKCKRILFEKFGLKNPLKYSFTIKD